MKWQTLAKGWVLALALVATTAWADQKLVGQWALNGQPYLVLNKDGTGTLERETFTWQAQGNTLVLSAGGAANVLPYRINGQELTLQIGIIPLNLQRIKGETASTGRHKPTGGPADTATSASDPLAQLLLSSAWCTFKYNQNSGASSTTRIQFFNNGTYSNSGRNESYSSGRYGTVAGQSDSGGSGQWAVRKGQLYISTPPEQPDLQPTQITVTRNSSGYPIIHAEGVEYASCR